MGTILTEPTTTQTGHFHFTSQEPTPLAVLVFGPPGCGKGRLSKVFKSLGFVRVVISDCLREFAKAFPEQDKKYKIIENINAATPCDDRAVKLAFQHALGDQFVGRPVFVDGAPRSRGQAKNLIQMFHGTHHVVLCHLRGSLELSLHRAGFRSLTETRPDSRPEDVEKRFYEQYFDHLSGIIGVCNNYGTCMISFDATLQPKDLQLKVLAKLIDLMGLNPPEQDAPPFQEKEN